MSYEVIPTKSLLYSLADSALRLDKCLLVYIIYGTYRVSSGTLQSDLEGQTWESQGSDSFKANA